MSDIITVRDGDIIAAEINVIKENAARVVISSAIEIGKRLVEAKSMVEHGQWGKWLEEKVAYSQSTANNMMKLYQEYGTGEANLFDNWTNSETFGKLSYTQHLALLALPFGERAEFAEQHQVADMSTRELEKAIRDRDANLQEVQRLTEENERITAGMVEAAEKLEDKDAEIEKLKAQVEKAKSCEESALKKVNTLKKKLEAAEKGEATARKELSQAKANPEIPEAVMEQMRNEVAAEAAEKATEQIRKELAAAQEEAARANQEKEAAEAQIAAAKRQSLMSNPDMALFNAHLTGAQEQFKKMLEALKNIATSDPATGEKLKGSIREKLLAGLNRQLDAV